MKKLFLLLMLTTGMTASAYDFPYLTFKTQSGTAQSVSVESLSLSISDGKLIASYNGGSAEFTLSDLSEMYFSETNEGSTTGISQVETTDGEVQIFSLTGVNMGTFSSLSKARAALKNGVYVVKTNTRSFKINIKN